ncbi:hypothetical protein MKZ38_004411 [Zalerion maritima]|uniref:Dynamin family protein n=1 Tax=Zalerion maritima TaxID=339359 RepID=A0AAD5WPW5_9PEZI|nr:hypothetical protein MKZ38_004411 [Zalerion maritima]
MAAAVALQSKVHRDLLDVIDRLRSMGTNRYVDLPEIIVCGDQSSGKSSVLEAISGMSFPTKDNLCTRFATELVLRRDANREIKVSIHPGNGRSLDEAERLSLFRRELQFQDLDLGGVIEDAKTAMGLSDNKVFSTDILRVELCGPTQPHLTMVDLPGLFRAGSKGQSVNDAKTVRDMVCGYMKRPRSIILAVVSAKSDFNLQDVTELARELDPTRTRTLGLITKPDTLDSGSESEALYLKLAQNTDVVFRLGWHVLKNRDYKMRDSSSSARDEAEEMFFAAGVWTGMNASHLGVASLRYRLSNVLKDQILLQLPNLVLDVEAGITDCKAQLERLGDARETVEEQRRYLHSVSQHFSSLSKAAVDGIYMDVFFHCSAAKGTYRRRLRAVVQNTLTKFEADLRLKGHARTILDEPSSDHEISAGEISRSDYIEEVNTLARNSRGCELAGTPNPLIINELFTHQCQPWREIATNAKNTILTAVDRAVEDILQHVTADKTVEGVARICRVAIDALGRDLDHKVSELLDPHYNTHPITYNRYLTDKVQKIQSDRRRKATETAVRDYFNLQTGNINSACNAQVVLKALIDRIDRRAEVNMERYASDLAIDYMQAYYKVAIKRFVDDFSVLAIERCLISKVPALFGLETVYNLSESDVSRLAGESEEASAERQEYTQKLAVLESTLSDLRRFLSLQQFVVQPHASFIHSTKHHGQDHRTLPWHPQRCPVEPHNLHTIRRLEEQELIPHVLPQLGAAHRGRPHVDNFRVGRITRGELFDLRVMENARRTTAPGRGIRKMSLNTTPRDRARSVVNPSHVLGYDQKRRIEDESSFENVRLTFKWTVTFCSDAQNALALCALAGEQQARAIYESNRCKEAFGTALAPAAASLNRRVANSSLMIE